ncbi:YqgE/AlgH family protein [Aestuariibius sp. HNIBRBA575]|uniref:YqgE/AlgH family protein n=1 Tax=Aestuariibius sp. HNIBRBA575 TaxID=3233343 RepID=UPI0034A16394
MKPTSQNLTGQLLIAMPDMADPRFHQSVVFVCAHSSTETMGLIINKHLSGVTFSGLLEQLDIASADAVPDLDIHYGGPVETARGFVLHSSEYGAEETTVRVSDHFGLSASLDILSDIAMGNGPKNALFTLGYAGWGPGQLEDEIGQNAWLSCPADPEIVIGLPVADKWSAALKSMGIDPMLLSSDAGHA